MKAKSKLGDSGYEVEWCSKLGRTEDGEEFDPDQNEMHFRDFSTLDEARAFAKEIFPQDQYGSVRITPFEIMPLSDTWPHGSYREYTGDGEHYEGDE